ncbi:MAG: beta-ketoacyl-[acyl-carrier-protein] synthase family protein, partial [Planctomycetaceae bacterium]
MSARRVAVTGIGLVTPFGPDRETSWAAIREGRSATRRLTAADGPEWSEFSRGRYGAIGAPLSRCLTDAGPAAGLPPASADPVTMLALNAAREAVRDARLDFEAIDRDRVGCVIGTSKGGLRSFQRGMRNAECGMRSHRSTPSPAIPHSALRTPHFQLPASPTSESEFLADWWLQFFPNTPALAVARSLGARGPALCPVAACATGLLSLARGAELVRDGRCDVVLAGSSDASLLPIVLSSFRRLGVLAKRCEDPATACRPFDRRRNGFVIGEGAAVMVMEPLKVARARGAALYAEWLAAGTAADAVGLTELDPRAEGLTWLIGDVLRRAHVAAAEIDYVNLHGTATLPNDRCET